MEMQRLSNLAMVCQQTNGQYIKNLINPLGLPTKFEAEMAEKAAKKPIDKKLLKGIRFSWRCEGFARFVESPAGFDEIQKDDILVCK